MNCDSVEGADTPLARATEKYFRFQHLILSIHYSLILTLVKSTTYLEGHAI